MIKIKNLRSAQPKNPYDVKVDRSNKVLGNCFHMDDESQREEVCVKYIKWFHDKIISCDPYFRHELNRLVTLYRIHGKLNLFCWCAPKRCHAETIRNHIINKLGSSYKEKKSKKLC
jgi:hypothetical protein